MSLWSDVRQPTTVAINLRKTDDSKTECEPPNDRNNNNITGSKLATFVKIKQEMQLSLRVPIVLFIYCHGGHTTTVV